MYYRICDNCGAWLDVGEKCDCCVDDEEESSKVIKGKKTDSVIPPGMITEKKQLRYIRQVSTK